MVLLKDSDANLRSSAASALESMGAEAKTALPQLVPLLKDSDANVRSPGVAVLLRNAFHLQKKEKTLTSPELNQAVSKLESALNILAQPEANFSQSTIANLRVYINALKAGQSNRPFIKSLPKNFYIWGIYIFVLLGKFAINPLRLLKIYETLKPK
ncbi:HEAT repeat domain-containing protein [Microcoleus sp. B4-C2]